MGKTYRYKELKTKGRCDKRKYKTEEEVRQMQSILKKKGREERRYYFCKICMAYHLTSKERCLLKEEIVANQENV